MLAGDAEPARLACLVWTFLRYRNASHLLAAVAGAELGRLSGGALAGRFAGGSAAHRRRGVHHALLFRLLGYVGQHAARAAAGRGAACCGHLAWQESMRMCQLVPCGLCRRLCSLRHQRRLVRAGSRAQKRQLELILDCCRCG